MKHLFVLGRIKTWKVIFETLYCCCSRRLPAESMVSGHFLNIQICAYVHARVRVESLLEPVYKL